MHHLDDLNLKSSKWCNLLAEKAHGDSHLEK